MSSTTLDHPDPTTERADPDRSQIVADTLITCYQLVRARRYAQADALLANIRTLQMSPRQELRVIFVRATVDLRLGRLPNACEQLIKGVRQAERVDDFGALAQLAFVYASALRELGQSYGAERFSMSALDAWRLYADPERADEEDSRFELDTLIQLNQLYFFSGKFVQAERVFRSARKVAQRASIPPLRRGNLAWIEALFYRWQSEPGRALDAGMRALAVIDEHAPPLERARLRTLLTDIALDLAERDGSGAADGPSYHFLGVAESYMSAARIGLNAERDPFALGLGKLADARLARLTNRNVNRLATIDAVAHMAMDYGDSTVLGQVWTARGDEYLALGQSGSARTCYQEAVDILTQARMQGHSVWPLRALRRGGWDG
jgi:tetratricopeptide (TPR) repeat protein